MILCEKGELLQQAVEENGNVARKFRLASESPVLNYLNQQEIRDETSRVALANQGLFATDIAEECAQTLFDHVKVCLICRLTLK